MRQKKIPTLSREINYAFCFCLAEAVDFDEALPDDFSAGLDAVTLGATLTGVLDLDLDFLPFLAFFPGFGFFSSSA